MPTNTSPMTSTTIPLPLVQNKFFVHVSNTPQSFSMAVVAVAINLVVKELMIAAEQSTSNQEHIIVQQLIDNPGFDVEVQLLDGNANVLDALQYIDCKVVDHLMILDYASSNPTNHDIKISFNKFKTLGGSNASQSAYQSAMSVVGKRSTP